MSEHLEIEFKTLVSPQDFKRLIDHFAIQKTDFFTQTNHYFDTDDFQLKAQRMGLRIRVLADRGELTLKVPAPEGLLEINDPLSLETANHFIKRNHLPTEGAVAKKLQ
ncbi:CYTH domain-containing protein, partial [Staphylococcus aureus]|nr:CYTH domain-containing protein [Staphylococcus aureus]